MERISCTYVVALLEAGLLAEQLIELVALVMITTETKKVRTSPTILNDQLTSRGNWPEYQ